MIKSKLFWLPLMGLLTWGLGQPTKASAELIFNLDFPVNTIVVNGCTGELVLVDGTLHVLETLTISTSGNINFDVKSNGSYKGTGFSSNAKYSGSSNDSSSLHIGTGGCPFSQDISTRFRLNTKGGKNNLFIEGFYHLSTNNACELTNFDFELVSATCK